jgi:hypothetical protein
MLEFPLYPPSLHNTCSCYYLHSQIDADKDSVFWLANLHPSWKKNRMHFYSIQVRSSLMKFKIFIFFTKYTCTLCTWVHWTHRYTNAPDSSVYIVHLCIQWPAHPYLKPGIHDASFASKSPFKFLEFKFFDRVYLRSSIISLVHVTVFFLHVGVYSLPAIFAQHV